jgi:hypothetical protein
MNLDTVNDGCCQGTTPCPLRPPGDELPGVEYRQDGRYCLACGSRLNQWTPARCPECGTETRERAK